MRQRSSKKIKMWESVNDYFAMVYSQPTEKRKLLDFKVGILALLLGMIFSLLFYKLVFFRDFLIVSFLVGVTLVGAILTAEKAGRVTQLHYVLIFLATFLFGLYLFVRGDNSRGVIMFGLTYPVLSIYILKSFWGNLLIGLCLFTSLLSDAYLNPQKMSEEICSLYICLYIMFWAFGVAMELARTYMERRLQQQQERLAYYANFDQLTELYNRRRFYECVHELSGTDHEAQPLVLLIFDVDNFKAINDTYGHSAGDRILSETAERIRRQTRVGDIRCRWGGEEFLILAKLETPEAGRQYAEKICSIIGTQPFWLSGDKSIPVTISVGAVFDGSFREEALERRIREADENLYSAKHAGKNRVCFSVSTPKQDPVPVQNSIIPEVAGGK